MLSKLIAQDHFVDFAVRVFLMADEAPHSMNLDLNLGPVDHPSQGGQPGSMNLENWLDGPLREAFGQRTRTRQRWRSVWRPGSIPIESRNIALELFSGNGMETGEGSVAPEEIPSDVAKTCDNYNGVLEDEAVKNKDDVEKGNTSEGNFFDCNICLDLASDPVVTCCGHLFCWPCLYRWLNIHSVAKECPICKGEVTAKSVTPIYGRGNKTRAPEDDSSLKIPHRPIARRVESLRQTIPRNNSLLRARELPVRSNSLWDQFLSTREILNELFNPIIPGQSDNVVDLPHISPTNSGQVEWDRLSSLLPRRSRRSAAVDSYFRAPSEERRQEQPPAVEDRDSISSIAAVIQSQSQTLDSTVEIDSTVILSTSSSSRRRREPSRTSDVDSGDSLRRSRRQR